MTLAQERLTGERGPGMTRPTALMACSPPALELIHVIPSVSEEASGPSYSVVRLCDALCEQQHSVTLAALDWAPLASAPSYLHVFPLGAGPRRLGRSPAMMTWLEKQCRSGACDVLHNHGMWQMNSVYPAHVARRHSVPLVWSPRGTFAAWAMRHGSRSKAAVWTLLQRPALLECSCFHATAFSEYEDIRRLGFRQPVCIIPNGIDLRPLPIRATGALRTLLFLGRLHSVKGLENLLAAWAGVETAFPDWQLRVVGEDAGYYGSTGYGKSLEALAQRLSLRRVEFVGPKYGQEKFQEYRNADLYVLPSHTENFGITVAEALSMETPVIASHGTPWGELSAQKAGWWVSNSPAGIAACLKEALSLPPQSLNEMGKRGRHWVARELDLRQVGESMARVYEWVSGRSRAKPDCVMTQ